MPDGPGPAEPTPAVSGEGAEVSDDQAAAAAAAALRRATRSTAPARRTASRSAGRGAAYQSGRDPQPVAAAIERLLAEQGWQDRSAVAVLMTEWADIVGRDLADHVVPIAYNDGELLLQAESTTWATQVRLLLPDLRRALDRRLGAGVVTAIRIQGPQAPTWGAGPRRVKGRGPRDTYG